MEQSAVPFAVNDGRAAKPRAAQSSDIAATRPARIWVTWEKQRRNVTMSEAFGCTFFEFDLKLTGVTRYAAALAMTLWTFIRVRPSTIFVQNPSMVLSAFAVVYGRLFRVPVIVDTHNSGIEPLRRTTRETRVAKFVLRRAALTILTNQSLAEVVRKQVGAAPIAIMPDPLPSLTRPSAMPALRGRQNVLFICTWAEDEPYLAVIEAARHLPSDTVVYITGKSEGKLPSGTTLPPNVVLTGYVDEETYVGLLFACDVVLDLTTWEDCLLCGGYEAVSAERPVVLSGTAALRSFFNKGALYTDNTPADSGCSAAGGPRGSGSPRARYPRPETGAHERLAT